MRRNFWQRERHECGCAGRIYAAILFAMSDLLADFERDCDAAGVKPTAVLKAAKIHTSLWWKWKADKTSPTLRNFEAAKNKLAEMREAKDRAPTARDAAA